MDILEQLNDKQKEAVVTIKGPVLVIAGAGSGKTKTLTHRIAYIIDQGVSPYNVLAVTFTNKAAGEMRERVTNLLVQAGLVQANREKTVLPTIKTFHALCAQILRSEIDKLGYNKDFTIFDSSDQLALMKKIIKGLGINPERFKPRSVLHAISDAKNELIDVPTYQDSNSGFFEDQVAKAYNSYQSKLKKINALDFDDLIMFVVKILKENPDVLAKYQDRFKYIMVDEYQDTNQAQYTLTRMLSEKNQNLCVVGDDWQCIYTWRKADFRNILNFEKDWPKSKVLMLEENYRSTQNILDASHGIISKNVFRTQKELWTKAEKGELIKVQEVCNEESEGNFIIDKIREIQNKDNGHKFNLKDFVVLYRTNAQSRAIEESFLKANMPYKIIGSVKFYSRKEVKDILAYLRVIINSQDTVSLERIINIPPRKLGKTSVDKIFAIPDVDISNKEMILNNAPITPQAAMSVASLSDIIYELKNELKFNNIVKFIRKVIEKIHYEKYINDGTPEGEARWENVEELITVAKKYESQDSVSALKQLLEDITLMSDQDQIKSNQDLVNLMTLHSVKGLEFPIVFITGCEEGLLPHGQSLSDPTQMEEERRLCYVGVTRAKIEAYMTFAARRSLFGRTESNAPSRFISDIPEHLVEFKSETTDYDDEEEIINLDNFSF